MSHEGLKQTLTVETSECSRVLLSLPDGAEVERIGFKAQPTGGPAAGWQFDEERHVQSLERGIAPNGPALDLLQIPLHSGEAPGLLEKARVWVEEQPSGAHGGVIILTLQGAQVVWTPGAAAVLAQPERLGLARRAVVEFACFESELRAIELDVAQGWPDLENDSPQAFDFNEKSFLRRGELGKRVQRSIARRSRLARLIPHLSHPPVFPPTLASQIGERLRERLRTQERLEFLDRQMEVFERVYEMCSTRASDFAHARTGKTLEMIIIVLLAAQLLFQILSYLSRITE